jgi:hypothetical protein
MRIRSGIGLAVTAAILEATAVPAQAALITFSSRALFAAAAPGLPVETFESGLVAPGAVTVCSGPVSSASASACFPLGGLLPGVTSPPHPTAAWWSSAPDCRGSAIAASYSAPTFLWTRLT